MCGLAGVLRFEGIAESDVAGVERMVSRLRHRGPDEVGFHHDSQIVLGHARLSIIDIEGGRQPIFNEDGNVVVVFNGEIFNHEELRRDLEKRGHVFSSRSDTEVIVHLYEERGLDFPEKLNGQFSIALWDKLQKRLVLCRDRFGITPLFHCWSDGGLLFASEVKAIAGYLERPLQPDIDALQQVFTFWAPVPGQTPFAGIEMIEPGCMMIVEPGHVETRRYWDCVFHAPGEYQRLDARLEADLAECFESAVALRLRADVPVGSYLSGGLDSSLVAMTALDHVRGRLATYSLAFGDPEFDERSWQSCFTSHSGIENRSIAVQEQDIRDAFVDSIWHTESPILRTAPVPMGLLSAGVHEGGMKVVLTGEGADELFVGYDLFKETRIRRFWARQSSSDLRPRLLLKLYPYLAENGGRAWQFLKRFYARGIDAPDDWTFSHLPRWSMTESARIFFREEWLQQAKDPYQALRERLPRQFDHWDAIGKAQYLEIRVLMANYLLSSQGERMQMKHSVEGRFPFLDHRLAERINRIDPRDKMAGLNEKAILKRMGSGRVPNAILARHKQPYRAPDARCFSAERDDLVDHLMSPESIGRYGLFDPERVRRLVAKNRAGRVQSFGDNQAYIGILSTQAMMYHFCDAGRSSA